MTPIRTFATAWVSDSITGEPIQALVYMWREADVIRAHHHCMTCGLNPIYVHFSLKWEPGNEKKAGQYFKQCKINNSETRMDIEKIFKKQLDEMLLPAGWES